MRRVSDCGSGALALGLVLVLAGSVPAAAQDSARAQPPDTVGPSEPDCARFPPPERGPYVLPIRPGDTVFVMQTTGHFRRSNRGVGLYAMDLRMPIGTPVHATRAGIVVATRDTFPDGNGENLKENFVFVLHPDGTVARYIHLTYRGALVGLGATVQQGQLIARSGNTGQTSEPHLHFDVQRCGPNLPPGYNQLPCGWTVPVTFRNTIPERCGLAPGRFYPALPFRPEP